MSAADYLKPFATIASELRSIRELMEDVCDHYGIERRTSKSQRVQRADADREPLTADVRPEWEIALDERRREIAEQQTTDTVGQGDELL